MIHKVNAMLVPIIALALLALSSTVAGNTYAQASLSQDQASELVSFADPQQRQRYYQLIAQLRCPKCQNQNLADSDAPIASDLRKELYLLISEGYTDREILDFMVSRYGEFVLYAPPVNSATAVLWLLPAGLVLIALLLAFIIVKRNSDVATVPAAQSSSTSEQALTQRIDKLLAEENLRQQLQEHDGARQD